MNIKTPILFTLLLLTFSQSIAQIFPPDSTVNLDRYLISKDTSEVLENTEKFTIVKHNLIDEDLGKKFKVNHVIDLDGQVFLSSDLGFLRRQNEGLVPVITSLDSNIVSYYLTKSENNLYPFDRYNLLFNQDGYILSETIGSQNVTNYQAETMLTKLMLVGDGRNFRLRNYDKWENATSVTDLGDVLYENYHLFGWGKTNGDHVIEQTIQRFHHGPYETREFISDISFESENYSSENSYVFEWDAPSLSYEQHPIDFLDVEIIQDSLHIFPKFYNSWNWNNESYNFSPNEGGLVPLTQHDIEDENPRSVTYYKESPIYLYNNLLRIGHPGEWIDYTLNEFPFLEIENIHVTNDHHIWLFGDEVCYEIIREQDLGNESNLLSNCSFTNTTLEYLQSCTDSTSAVVFVQFTDEYNGTGEYNIYRDQELIHEISNTNEFELELPTDSSSQSVELIIQDKNDLLCKQTLTFTVACILDQDNDGFTSDVDCDDNNPDVNPDAIEILDNDIDEDCDGADLSDVHDLEGIRISIFPNPANSYINIELDAALPLSFKLFNIQGKLLDSGILSQKLNHKINVESYANGMYHLEITNTENKVKVVERIIKMQ